MRTALLPVLALSFLVACASSEDDEGTGGQGGGRTVTSGSTSTTTTGSPTTTTSGMMTTSSSTASTSSSGGGGMGGEGGMNEGGGPPAEYILETEPNDTFGQANDLPDGAPGFAAELPDGDIDVFAVDAALGATMSVVVSDGYGSCPADANVLVQIYDPSDLVIASAGASLCPSLTPANDPDLLSLVQAGTYFVYVTAPAEVDEYIIDITVNDPICGDNVTQLGEECDDGNMTPADGCENDCTVTPVCGDNSIQTGEECDDGNTNDGDGCDSLCQFEGSLCPETEANNSIATANAGPGCTAWMGQIGMVGDHDYFAVEVTVAGSRIDAEVVDVSGTGCPSGFDSTLRVFNPAMAEIAYDDDGAAAGLCSLIDPSTDTGASNLPAGTYYLAVRELGDDATSAPYRLNVNVVEPGCGDGNIQAPEECDDGNLAAGDGCSPTCTFEAGVCGESEPNNDLASADVLNTCMDAFTQITTIGDHDWFQITIPTTGTDLHVHIEGPASASCPSGADPHIYLYDGTGTLLGENDDTPSPFSLCSTIDPATNAFAQNLAAGTYYLEVREHNDDEADPPIRVKIQFLP